MKVRCIKLISDDESIDNNDFGGHLEIGEEYYVAGVFVDNENN